MSTRVPLPLAQVSNAREPREGVPSFPVGFRASGKKKKKKRKKRKKQLFPMLEQIQCDPGEEARRKSSKPVVIIHSGCPCFLLEIINERIGEL